MTTGEGKKCYICRSPAHLARDCAKRKELGSKAAELNPQKDCGLGQKCHRDEEPLLYGQKSSTEVRIGGRWYAALLDTGPEISILPETILRHLRKEGCEMVERAVDATRKISDASGNCMKFVAVVDVPMSEAGNKEVLVRMH
ncbi:unnamed protein product [Nippostrongylus brasiliensis]|uniref:CCHC-type domain-containing protein n=1 Tax=Nippostrongylus brasiliensis TaxID=27835 RepID=A0A0N4XFI5_NIPBR|nr:unnamed protein product [Nippostrongylus brasiliensis]